MPLDDNGGVFVTATVSLLEHPNTLGVVEGRRNWVVQKLSYLDAVPFVTFVRPIEGYGETFRGKMEKMNYMAKITRLINRANAEYLTNEGIPRRNFVWLHCMGQAIGHAILSNISTNKIERVEIFLDQKTMAPPTRKFFRDRISSIDKNLRKSLNWARQFSKEMAHYLENNVSFDSDSISLTWSDDPSAEVAQHGLKLAHYLSKQFNLDLSKSKIPKIAARLSQAGFQNFYSDATELLMRPIGKNAIKIWERNTGLREPL